MVKFNEVANYKDYGKCISICNGIIEALVTIDVGPRIISFSFINGKNVMNDNRDAFDPVCGKEFDTHYYPGAKWENLGGHRLWASPESLPETYYPDTEPVDYTINGNTITFTPPPQKENGIAFEIDITMSETAAEMSVMHKGKNISNSNKKFALWALSVMAPGGVEIIPQNTNDTGLLPNRSVVIWPYADIRDERLFIGNKYITLKQTSDGRAFKLGTDCNAGVGYYCLGDVVFAKKYQHTIGAEYPDGGVSYETYTNETFLEFETLSPLKELSQNEEICHEEIFSLYKKPCDFDPTDEKSIEQFITKL